LYNQYNAPNVRLSDSEFIELASVLFTRAEYRNNVGLQQNLDAVIGRILKDRTTANGTVIAASRLLHRYSMSLDSARRLDAVLANKVVIDARGSFLDVSAGGSYLDTALTNTAGYVDLLSVRRQNDSQLPDLLRWILASREKDGASKQKKIVTLERAAYSLAFSMSRSSTSILYTSATCVPLVGLQIIQDREKIIPLVPSLRNNVAVIFPQLSSFASKIMVEKVLEDEKMFLHKILGPTKGTHVAEVYKIDVDDRDIENAKELAARSSVTIFFCFDAPSFSREARIQRRRSGN
jgi:hypothetical protein